MIRMKIKLCKSETFKLEGEINDTIELGQKALTIINNGLSHRVLAIESRLFYNKLEVDLYRYKLEIMQHRWKMVQKGMVKEELEDPDINRPPIEFVELREETREMYLKACDSTEVFEATNPLRTSLFLNYSVFLYEVCE